MLGCFWISPGEQEDVVGELRLGRPHLLALDHPFVAVEIGTCLERRQVASGVGFGEPLAPRDRAVEDLGDELSLLFLGSPLQDGRAHEGVPEEVRPHGRHRTGEFLVEDDLLDERETLASVFLGPRGTDPSPLAQLSGPIGVERLALGTREPESGLEPTLGEVVLQPAPDLLAQGLCLRRVRQVHEARTYRRTGVRSSRARVPDPARLNPAAPLSPRAGPRPRRGSRTSGTS